MIISIRSLKWTRRAKHKRNVLWSIIRRLNTKHRKLVTRLKIRFIRHWYRRSSLKTAIEKDKDADNFWYRQAWIRMNRVYLNDVVNDNYRQYV